MYKLNTYRKISNVRFVWKTPCLFWIHRIFNSNDIEFIIIQPLNKYLNQQNVFQIFRLEFNTSSQDFFI